MTNGVLAEIAGPRSGTGLWLKRAALLAFGVAAMAAAAKVKVPLWPSPVPITFGTFAAMSLGALYGPRLGAATLLAWIAVGAAGLDVFAGSGAASGLAYLAGPTGGYVAGFALAAALTGALAARGWDRSPWRMAVAMALGTALIYAPGLLWLRGFAEDWTQTLVWGLWPFLVGDALKLALAAALIPAVRRLAGRG
ncbi:MAG: biotin transporter BioY [Paracoccaceae bacterium]